MNSKLKYKIGDRVKIKDICVGAYRSKVTGRCEYWVYGMNDYIGRIGTIVGFTPDYLSYRVKIDGNCWSYIEEWLELVSSQLQFSFME